MPRLEINAPSERMGRVLDAFDELEAYAQVLETLLLEHAPQAFEQAPPRPTVIAVVEERLRRQISLSTTRRKREYMRHARATGEAAGQGSRATGFSSIRARGSEAQGQAPGQTLDPATQEEILAEIKALPTEFDLGDALTREAETQEQLQELTRSPFARGQVAQPEDSQADGKPSLGKPTPGEPD